MMMNRYSAESAYTSVRMNTRMKVQELVEKFREFTDHYIDLVEGYGKQACVWGALTHAKGTTPVKSENVNYEFMESRFCRSSRDDFGRISID